MRPGALWVHRWRPPLQLCSSMRLDVRRNPRRSAPRPRAPEPASGPALIILERLERRPIGPRELEQMQDERPGAGATSAPIIAFDVANAPISALPDSYPRISHGSAPRQTHRSRRGELEDHRRWRDAACGEDRGWNARVSRHGGHDAAQTPRGKATSQCLRTGHAPRRALRRTSCDQLIRSNVIGTH